MANAVEFNGSSQYGKINNFSGLDGLTDFTVEMWIKRTASGGSYDYYWQIRNTAGGITFARLRQESGSPSDGCNFSSYYAGTNADGYIADGSGFFPAGAWHHYAFIHRATEKKTFLLKNGVEYNAYPLQQTGVSTQDSSNSSDFWLAVDQALSAYGAIQVGGFVRIWNRALTAGEVYDNKDVWVTPANETGLIVQLRFSEGSGTVIDNDATAGADMNLTGTPTWNSSGPTISEKSYTVTVKNYQVKASADDAEENTSGTTNDIVSNDIEVCYDGAAGQVGFRFQGVAIPNAQTIDHAYLRLVGDENQSTGTVTATIYGEDADNASAFSGGAGDVSGRTKTTASVSWTVPATVPGTMDTTPDIKTVIQEIVDRAGWSSGNNLALILTSSDANRRTYEAYDSQPYSAAILHIEYTVGGVTEKIKDIIMTGGMVPFKR